MSKHTDGPWTFGHWGDDFWIGTDGSGQGQKIARVTWGMGEVVSEGRENARLIAAAPDLKSVADTIVITGPDADGFVWLQINSPNFPQRAAFNLGSAERLAGKAALEFERDRRAAIAKAEGR